MGLENEPLRRYRKRPKERLENSIKAKNRAITWNVWQENVWRKWAHGKDRRNPRETIRGRGRKDVFRKFSEYKMGLSATWGDVDWGLARWGMKAHILGKYSHSYQEILWVKSGRKTKYRINCNNSFSRFEVRFLYLDVKETNLWKRKRHRDSGLGAST
jgi:hypothetical protein